MKKIMFVGKTGCGKTTLTQAIQGQNISYRKTQAVSYSGAVVDTPGEFVENRRFYSALVVSSYNCDIIGFVQDATTVNSIFPPKFASMFTKKVVGIITKSDCEDCNFSRAEKFLKWAGACEIIQTSAVENIGIDTLQTYLV
ncbi:MAG: EutP/PduV family microcompartment system protein [Thermodesulfobacteriota bacterium]|nr:EutP/PduV family microcompartment system protein [Thermodesulfobacteriota bacterium]